MNIVVNVWVNPFPGDNMISSVVQDLEMVHGPARRVACSCVLKFESDDGLTQSRCLRTRERVIYMRSISVSSVYGCPRHKMLGKAVTSIT